MFFERFGIFLDECFGMFWDMQVGTGTSWYRKRNNLKKGVCDQWSFWQAGAVCVCSQGFFCFGLRSVPFSLGSVTPGFLAMSLVLTSANSGCGWVRLCLAGTLPCAVMDGLTDLN